MSCWDTLAIEATSDKKQIKRAYAKKIKQFNPEDHPDEFQEVRAAYEQALQIAPFIEREDVLVDEQNEEQEESFKERAQSESKNSSNEKNACDKQTNEYSEDSIVVSIPPEFFVADDLTQQEPIEEEFSAQSTSSITVQDELTAETNAETLAREFIDKLQQLISTEQGQWQSIDNWRQLFQDEILFDLEVKRILHYMVFEFINDYIVDCKEQNSAIHLYRAHILYLAEQMNWLDNELELERFYGAEVFDRVINFGLTKSVINPVTTVVEKKSSNKYQFLIWVLFFFVIKFVIGFVNEQQDKYSDSSSSRSSGYSNSGDPVEKACREMFGKDSVNAPKQVCEKDAGKGHKMAIHYMGLYELRKENYVQATVWFNRSKQHYNTDADFWIWYIKSRQENNILAGLANIESCDSARNVYCEAVFVALNFTELTFLQQKERLENGFTHYFPESMQMRYLMYLQELNNSEYNDWQRKVIVDKLDDLIVKIAESGQQEKNPRLINFAIWNAATRDEQFAQDENLICNLLQKYEASLPQTAVYLDTLAAAYASIRQFDRAIQLQEQAINLLGNDNKILQEEFAAHFSLYRNNQNVVATMNSEELQQQLRYIAGTIPRRVMIKTFE